MHKTASQMAAATGGDVSTRTARDLIQPSKILRGLTSPGVRGPGNARPANCTGPAYANRMGAMTAKTATAAICTLNTTPEYRTSPTNVAQPSSGIPGTHEQVHAHGQY